MLALAATAASAEPTDGQTYTDWTVKCETAPGAQSEQCFMFQNRVLRDTGKRILHTSVGYLPGQSEPVMLLTTPLGVSLPHGLVLWLDDEVLAEVPFQVCQTQGCRGGLKLEGALLERLRAGGTARVVFHDAQRREVDLPVSLAGFSEALAALRP